MKIAAKWRTAHQGWRVLVWPERLWYGPVANRDPCLWVWANVDEFVAAMPGLRVKR